MRSNRLALIFAAAFFCTLPAQPAGAQTLYKSIMPDGRVVYGDKPAPGAAKVEQPQIDTSKGGLGGSVTPREQGAVKEMERSQQQREASQARFQAATQALKDAEAARDGGKEPREGERIGTAGGASRLNEAYFERQRRLEAAVEKARRDLEQTR